jgi:hypothetical protein
MVGDILILYRFVPRVDAPCNMNPHVIQETVKSPNTGIRSCNAGLHPVKQDTMP